MKKANSEKDLENDDMLAEYDFSGAVRGKFYKPLHEGYTVDIHMDDGTTVVREYRLQEGAVLLEPDVREYFPDSEAVNKALRSLIDLMAQMPQKRKARVKPSGVANV